MEKKGWIALDIDGTITDRTHQAPKKVIDYLHALKESGWEIVFITGRTFSFAYSVMQAFDFPYYLALQNGADILAMPEKRSVWRHYLDTEVLPLLEKAYEGEEEHFLLYAGYEHGDFCYYNPGQFSPKFRAHLEKIKALSPEPWKAVEHFHFDPPLHFPLAKCLGSKEGMERVQKRLEGTSDLSVTLIRDPLGEEIYLNLVTCKEATKGKALQKVQRLLDGKGKVIAAGDDLNDVSMLKEADVKIVMETAPEEMLGMADIVAPSGDACGIIEALEEATKRWI